MNKMRIEHLVLVGLDFQNKKSSGDKNFWVDLISLLAHRLKRIDILSIRKETEKKQEFLINGCRINIKFLLPRLLENPEAAREKKFFWKSGTFPSWLGIIEKTIGIKQIIQELLSLKEKNPFQHVHFMDNFGFGNRLISRAIRMPVTVSAMAYQGKKPEYIYNSYLRLSYDAPYFKIVAYNDTLRNKLIEIGIDSKKVYSIPWGVYINNRRIVSDSEKAGIKSKLNIPSNRPLILWSGYIQQIQREDFLYSYNIAKKALKNGLQATFFFAFKPESFERPFTKLMGLDNNKIIVKATDIEEFQNLIRCCDVFFSPILNKRVVLAPPLTWIELLNNGVPIITTPVPGTENVIVSGKTGFVSWIADELIERLDQAITQHAYMANNCIEMVNNNFNIEASVNRYLELFNK